MARRETSCPGDDRASRAAERRAICIEALALAQRAAVAGLPLTAYLIDMAALELQASEGWLNKSS